MVAGWSTGGRLVDHHQHLPLCLQALVDLSQLVLVVGKGPVEDLPARPGSGPWPSARSLPTPGTDEDLDVLDILLSCRLPVKLIRGQPANGPAPAPTPAKV